MLPYPILRLARPDADRSRFAQRPASEWVRA